jgi:hypothetical protein
VQKLKGTTGLIGAGLLIRLPVFPAGTALAATWNPQLALKQGLLKIIAIVNSIEEKKRNNIL